MAQEIINIGSLPNDGTGDPMRLAFAKVNNNFFSLFTESSAVGPDGAIQYNTITVGSGADVESVISSGAVVDFIINYPGTGYKETNLPTVTITPAFGDTTGYGATATAIITDGEITGFMLLSSGADYSLAPTVTISDTVTNEFTGSTKLIFDSTTNVLSSGVDFIPQVDSFYTIGNSANRFGGLYLTNEGMFLGNVQVSEDANVVTLAVAVNTSVKADLVVGDITGRDIAGNTLSAGNTKISYMEAETYGPSGQVIFQLPAGEFLSGKLDIYSSEANTVNTQTASITCAKSGDGTSVNYIVTNALYGNQPVVSDYDMTIQTGYLTLTVTPIAEEETVTHKITYQTIV